MKSKMELPQITVFSVMMEKLRIPVIGVALVSFTIAGCSKAPVERTPEEKEELRQKHIQTMQDEMGIKNNKKK